MSTYTPAFFLLTLALLIACGSTGEVTSPERAQSGSTERNTETQAGNEGDPSGDTDQQTVSRLEDYYSTQSNEIPEAFRELKVPKEVEVDLTKGFRIQIYSGQSLEDADTTAMRFRAWSDTTLVGYQPETYTFFKTPYYRVHVGDFHDRERALALSRIIKRAFRDAWVVYDTVDPFAVPSDTTEISIR